MKIVIQRVLSAKCLVNNKEIAQIKHGYLLLTCFEKGDDNDSIDRAVEKILNLRIFEDDDGKMNLNISQVKGEILNISQFTLSWDGRKGHRPSFDRSMSAREANLKFEILTRKLNDSVPTHKGEFGADMQIELINDGPVTFHLDL